MNNLRASHDVEFHMSDSKYRRALPREMPSGLLLRIREAADIEGLFELLSEASFQHFGTGMPPYASADDVVIWLNSLSKNRFEPVAIIDNEVVGMGGLYVFDGRHNHMGSVFLAVKEKFQGRGIGRALMTSLIMASDLLLSLHRLQLNVFGDNERALQMYHDFGFEIEGRHRDFLQRRENYVNAYTMARIRDPALDNLSITEMNASIRAALSLVGQNRGTLPGGLRQEVATRSHAADRACSRPIP
ncbi:MAG TPA: GNAT family N-acetyltransferase [Methylocella sp.]|nr:GNAT family N-acetyltransferase [Methylocella sp.]